MANRSGRLRILLITGNRSKAREVEEILAQSFPEAFEVEVSGEIGKIEIQSEDLAEIAVTSLRSILREIGRGRWHSIVVEDSGLFIEALGGFPGPYSSYVKRSWG